MKLVTQKQRQFLDNNGTFITAGSPLGTLAASNTTLGTLATSNVVLGTVATANKCATQAASTAVDAAGIVVDFNALLVKLKAAGIVL